MKRFSLRKSRKALCRVGLSLTGAFGVYIAILAYPQPAFAYRLHYRQFDIWSDRPIDNPISAVLDDATRRLKTSILYTPEQHFHVFICNTRWRLQLYGIFHPRVGGIVIAPLTSNTYLREADIIWKWPGYSSTTLFLSGCFMRILRQRKSCWHDWPRCDCPDVGQIAMVPDQSKALRTSEPSSVPSAAPFASVAPR